MAMDGFGEMPPKTEKVKVPKTPKVPEVPKVDKLPESIENREMREKMEKEYPVGIVFTGSCWKCGMPVESYKVKSAGVVCETC